MVECLSAIAVGRVGLVEYPVLRNLLPPTVFAIRSAVFLGRI